jgi:hypothetical protein
MKSNGWCLRSAYRISLQFNYSVAYFHALCRRRSSRDPLHRGCSRLDCMVGDSNATDRTPLPIRPECTCAHIPVPAKGLSRIKDEDGTPVVSIKQSAHGKLELHVRRATTSTAYVAISHDPFDGLGNSTANSLPHCQLERIQLLLNQLQYPNVLSTYWSISGYISPVYMDFAKYAFQRVHASNLQRPFWIDTFCIPIQMVLPSLRRNVKLTPDTSLPELLRP